MKKKFLSVVSLLLAAVMMFPTAAFADTTGTENSEVQPAASENFEILLGSEVVSGTTLDLYDGGTKNTVTLKVPDEYKNVQWSSKNPDVATVEGGVVTAKAVSGEEAKTADIIARYEDPETFDIITKVCTVKVSHRQIVKVDLTAKKNAYYVGETITKENLEVKAYYNDAPDTPIVITDYTIVSPSGALTTTDKVVKIKAESVEKEAEISVTAVDVTSLIDKIEIVKPTRTSYTEGDTMEGVYIKVTYKDNTNPSYTITNTGDSATAGISQIPAGGTKLKTTDTTLTVTYEGKTATAALTVAAKTPSGGTSGDTSGDGTTTTPANTIEYEGSIPKEYKVGDKIDFSKVTKLYLVTGNVKTPKTGTAMTSILNALKNSLVFTSSNVGTNTVKLEYTLGSGTTAVTYTLTLTDIKVSEKTVDPNLNDDDGPYEIRDVEMRKDKYDIGYEFSLDDIKIVEVKWTRTGSAYDIYGEDLDDYAADPTIEVLDKDGETKSRTYRDTIEEDDVLTDRYGDKYVQLLLTFGDEEYEFDVEVGAEPVQFIHRNKVIITYEDIEDALDATLDQDSDISEDIFELDEDVTSSRPITIKLGEDAYLDDDYEYDPTYPVVIDLNGHTLTIHSTTVDMSRKNDGNLTITNSSKTAGKVVYDDMAVTVTLAEDEELVFEYDADTLPGLYTVEVSCGKNGSLAAKPSLSKNDTIEAGAGSVITFTIKPSTNYQLDAIKVDGKAVAASAYTKATSGVITYKYTVGKADAEIEVTFKTIKAEVVEPEWENPYTDVRSTSAYMEAVEFVTKNQLMNGTSATTFSPNKTMNRAMFVTVLGRLAGVDTSKYTKSSFIDVPLNSSTSWYAPYVEWANQNGIIQGYGNGKFGPMDEITHQQLYTIVYRYAVFVENIRFNTSSTSITVSDKNDIDSYAIDGVKFATANDMLVTSGGEITPKSGALRWELATVLQLFCENVLHIGEAD